MAKVLRYFMIGLVFPFLNHCENSHTTSMKIGQVYMVRELYKKMQKTCMIFHHWYCFPLLELL